MVNVNLTDIQYNIQYNIQYSAPTYRLAFFWKRWFVISVEK
jgi:hypothetical protein